jgi:hypothetical protein
MLSDKAQSSASKNNKGVYVANVETEEDNLKSLSA